MLGTAFVHYSDTATLAESDLIAPITTAFAPIPLSEEDRAAYGPSDDPFSLADGVIYLDTDTDHLDPIDLNDDHYLSSSLEADGATDTDPIGLDTAEATAAEDTGSDHDGSGSDPNELDGADLEVEFGTGHDPDSPVGAVPTAAIDALASDEGFDGDQLDLARPAQDFTAETVDELDGAADSLDVTDDPTAYPADIDPADLDFDIL